MNKILLISLIVVSVTFFACNPKGKSNQQSTQETEIKADTVSHVSQSNQQPASAQQREQKPDLTYSSQQLSSNRFHFTIWFPDTPSVRVDTFVESGHKIANYTYLYKGEDFVYMLSVSKYPEELLSGQNLDTVLHNVMYGFVNSQGLNVESSEYKTVQGEPALVYRGYKGDLYMVNENIIYDNIIYQIIMANKGEYSDPVAINDFMGSFKLLK